MFDENKYFCLNILNTPFLSRIDLIKSFDTQVSDLVKFGDDYIQFRNYFLNFATPEEVVLLRENFSKKIRNLEERALDSLFGSEYIKLYNDPEELDSGCYITINGQYVPLEEKCFDEDEIRSYGLRPNEELNFFND